jgi:uncharacterized protein
VNLFGYEVSSAALKTIGLLVCSNIFMTTAWYGHLKFRGLSLIQAIFISWGIALFEYALQVPANRIGYEGQLSGYKLKIIQECITLCVFIGFAWLVLGETPQWKHLLAFGFILCAVIVTFI